MDIEPQTTQSMSDDQELAKVLAGVSQQADDTLQFEETPAPVSSTPAVADNTPPAEAPSLPPLDSLVTPAMVAPVAAGSDLEGIKKDALSELRPLVDKLDLAPEEKFDTYLLLIRSTDDRALIAPAHVAAQAIADESRRAQALLDIIKEIDFLSNQA
jgi:hypothetical protein